MTRPLKWLITVLVLTAAVCCGGVVYAESGTCGADMRWTLEDGVLTISGTGSIKDYRVPWDDAEDYHASVAIPPWENAYVSTLIIEEGVTRIGEGAFMNRSSLTSVTFPSTLTEIGDAAFRGCSSLASIALPDSVTSLGMAAFDSCTSLTNFTTPASLRNLSDFLFNECVNLRSVTLNHDMGIGYKALASSVTVYCPKGGVAYKDAFYWGLSTVADGKAAWTFDGSTLTIHGSNSVIDYMTNGYSFSDFFIITLMGAAIIIITENVGDMFRM